MAFQEHMNFFQAFSLGTGGRLKSLADTKRKKIKELSKDLLPCNKVTIQKLPEWTDNLVACFSAVTFGTLQYRDLEKVKITGLNQISQQ